MLLKIKNEKLSAAVSTEGAELMSVKGCHGFEYLWQGDPAYWSGRAPVLFPIVGAVRNGRVSIKGKSVAMKRHGFAGKREFEVEAHTTDEIILRLCADNESLELYPYKFILRVCYKLKGATIITGFEVENAGAEIMPFCIGGHPAYNIPANEDAAFEDYSIVFESEENQSCPVVDLDSGLINITETSYTLRDAREIPLAHELFYRDALVFEQLRSRRAAVINRKSGHGFKMDFTGFPMLGIWSAQNDGPYVALEPWTGCATLTTEGDVFEEKKNMTFLPRGEKKEYCFSVSFFDLARGEQFTFE